MSDKKKKKTPEEIARLKAAKAAGEKLSPEDEAAVGEATTSAEASAEKKLAAGGETTQKREEPKRFGATGSNSTPGVPQSMRDVFKTEGVGAPFKGLRTNAEVMQRVREGNSRLGQTSIADQNAGKAVAANVTAQSAKELGRREAGRVVESGGSEADAERAGELVRQNEIRREMGLAQLKQDEITTTKDGRQIVDTDRRDARLAREAKGESLDVRKDRSGQVLGRVVRDKEGNVIGSSTTEAGRAVQNAGPTRAERSTQAALDRAKQAGTEAREKFETEVAAPLKEKAEAGISKGRALLDRIKNQNAAFAEKEKALEEKFATRREETAESNAASRSAMEARHAEFEKEIAKNDAEAAKFDAYHNSRVGRAERAVRHGVIRTLDAIPSPERLLPGDQGNKTMLDRTVQAGQAVGKLPKPLAVPLGQGIPETGDSAADMTNRLRQSVGNPERNTGRNLPTGGEVVPERGTPEPGGPPPGALPKTAPSPTSGGAEVESALKQNQPKDIGGGQASAKVNAATLLEKNRRKREMERTKNRTKEEAIS
jgi:hypothetical protein